MSARPRTIALVVPLLLLAAAFTVALPATAGPATTSGTGSAWGFNGSGQLGNGTNIFDSNVPVQVSGLTSAAAVAGGYAHSLAVRSDGTVWSWGLNNFGQLGNGTHTDRDHPVQVSGLTGAVAAAGGLQHSLAVSSDGTVRAWGSNGSGQLGDGTNTDSNVPVQVSGLTDAVAVTAGDYQSLADGAPPPPFPLIVGITPSQGRVGQAVTISGLNLGTTTGVWFSDRVRATFQVISDTELRVKVPDGALYGQIEVRTPAGKALSPFFFVLPTVGGFSPPSGPPGTEVTITGSAFIGTIRVKFNGTPATFTVDGYGQVTATVPAGATTGSIMIRTFGRAHSAESFVVT